MTQQYIRYDIVPLNVVFSAIRANSCISKPKYTYNGYTFNVISLRLQTFYQDFKQNKLCCASCELKAEFFAIESAKNDISNKSVHINLYGKLNNKDILFTHDHTLARKLGGSNHLSNMKTMCSPCNAKKGKLEAELVTLLREESKC